MTASSSTPPLANESEGVPFKLPLSVGVTNTSKVLDARGVVIANLFFSERADYLVHAVNAHAKLESENAGLRKVLEEKLRLDFNVTGRDCFCDDHSCWPCQVRTALTPKEPQ